MFPCLLTVAVHSQTHEQLASSFEMTHKEGPLLCCITFRHKQAISRLIDEVRTRGAVSFQGRFTGSLADAPWIARWHSADEIESEAKRFPPFLLDDLRRIKPETFNDTFLIVTQLLGEGPDGLASESAADVKALSDVDSRDLASPDAVSLTATLTRRARRRRRGARVANCDCHEQTNCLPRCGQMV